jgi:hypothetical protein
MGQRERKIDIVNMPKSGYLQRNQMFTEYRRMNVGTLVISRRIYRPLRESVSAKFRYCLIKPDLFKCNFARENQCAIFLSDGYVFANFGLVASMLRCMIDKNKPCA